MWIYKTSNREDILNIFSKDISRINVVNCSYNFIDINSNDTYMRIVWENDPNKYWTLPSLFIVPENIKRDFIAWAVTFIGAYHPFTAFFRVIDTDTYKLYENATIKPSLEGYENACAGLIIAEALTLSEPNVNPNSLTINSCASTYSYIMSRAMSLNLASNNQETLSNRWKLVRMIMNQPDRKIDNVILNNIWHIMESLKKYDKDYVTFKNTNKYTTLENIRTMCLEIKNYGDIKKETWENFTEDVKDLKYVLNEMKGTREQRVTYFETAIKSFYLKNINDSEKRDFICGYLASSINPGSMEYYKLVRQYTDTYPLSLLWYGMISGLYKNSDIQNENDCLGRRLIRDLLRNESIFDRPRSDISLDELHVYLSGDKYHTKFRRNNINVIEIEIYPGITTILKWQDADRVVQQTLYSSYKTDIDPDDTIAEMGHLLSRLNDLYTRMSQYGKSSKYNYKKKYRK